MVVDHIQLEAALGHRDTVVDRDKIALGKLQTCTYTCMVKSMLSAAHRQEM